MIKIGIYKITSPTGKIYIGQSIDIKKRFSSYRRLNCKSQPRLLASLKKHGHENHCFEIIHICEKTELPTKEKHFVDLYQTFNSKHGLNIRDGGGNCANLSYEQKKKISNSLRGVKHPEERVEKNRLGQIGKKMSEDSKKKMSLNSSKSMLGKHHSEETKMKLSESHKGQIPWMTGKFHSQETKLKLSIINSGENNPNFGKKRSLESRMKTSQSLMGHSVSEKCIEIGRQRMIGKKLSSETIAKREKTRRERDIEFSRRNYK